MAALYVDSKFLGVYKNFYTGHVDQLHDQCKKTLDEQPKLRENFKQLSPNPCKSSDPLSTI